MPPQEGKIRSKDLSYSTSLPPFLQRLHAQHTGNHTDRDPDRHENPVARPKRVKTGDDDDGPTVVDESGETVSKAELEKLTNGSNEDTLDGDGAKNVTGAVAEGQEPVGSGAIQAGENAAERSDDKVTDGRVVGSKKRKVGKVVGEDVEEDATEIESKDQPSAKKFAKKVKKKAKPIKLAFDDEGDEG